MFSDSQHIALLQTKCHPKNTSFTESSLFDHSHLSHPVVKCTSAQVHCHPWSPWNQQKLVLLKSRWLHVTQLIDFRLFGYPTLKHLGCTTIGSLVLLNCDVSRFPDSSWNSNSTCRQCFARFKAPRMPLPWSVWTWTQLRRQCPCGVPRSLLESLLGRLYVQLS